MTLAMLPALLPALLAWIALMVLASAAGLALVGAWPWAARARASGVAFAAGLAVAPLLAGLVMVAVLWAWPGAAPRAQAAVVFAVLAVAAAAGYFSGAIKRALVPGSELLPRGPAAVLTWGFFVALLLDVLTVPLIQNDALEYATVGRILFDTRDLASYPALQPQRHASGFYGPWTHPPLYVALVALGNALQGGSEHTLLMRLVAPWCLAGAAACVAALVQWARPARPGDAPLAALLLVSTPLLFLGAASALIDALPVLGLTLAFVAAVALAGAWWQRALGLGVMLGVALWTHSQAVLVPLLVLPLLLGLPAAGRRGACISARLGQALAIGVPALMVALALGAAPYVRNVGLFGAPISDTPIVFALPSLDWAGWFQVQRGLTSVAELVQYGLLKPWFAVEAYGLVFWLVLPAVFALRHARQPLPAVPDGGDHVRPLALSLLGLYLAGALLSLALGIDLMVRNERYMLVLLPAAAIVAAMALNRPWLRGVIIALLGVQLAVLLFYRIGQLTVERTSSSSAAAGAVARADGGTALAAADPRLQRWGPYGAVSYLREQTPPASLVLSMKPADMFYAGRTMVSYLDPRLLPFYGERDAGAAAARLRELGITHVHLPDYWLPPVYHSALASLLADPALAELVFEAHGYQIHALRAPGAAAQAAAGTPASPTARPSIGCGPELAFQQWERGREFVLGGRKNLKRVNLGATPLSAGEESRSWNPTPFFLRETNTVLRAHVELPRAAASSAPSAGPSAGPSSAVATNEWLLHLELDGAGYVQVIVHPRGEGGAPQLVADRPLGPPGRAAAAGTATSTDAEITVVQRRLRIDADTQRLDLRLEHRADSRLRVQRAALVPMSCPARATSGR